MNPKDYSVARPIARGASRIDGKCIGRIDFYDRIVFPNGGGYSVTYIPLHTYMVYKFGFSIIFTESRAI